MAIAPLVMEDSYSTSFSREESRQDALRKFNEVFKESKRSLLTPPLPSRSMSCRKVLKWGTCAVFFPVTLPAYGVHLSMKKLATRIGIGKKGSQDLKVNDGIRVHLTGQDLKGEEFLFGFEGQALLEGIYFRGKENLACPKTILLCPGSHKSFEKDEAELIEAIVSLGHNVFAFNYEGFGRSEGGVSLEGLFRSAQKAYQFLIEVKGCQEEQIVVLGRSLGSGPAIALAIEHHIDLILERPISSLSDMAKEHAPMCCHILSQIIFKLGADFNNVKRLPLVQGRVLLIQAMQDERVSSASYAKLLKAMPQKSGIHVMIDSGHYDLQRSWAYEEGPAQSALIEYLRKASEESLAQEV